MKKSFTLIELLVVIAIIRCRGSIVATITGIDKVGGYLDDKLFLDKGNIHLDNRRLHRHGIFR